MAQLLTLLASAARTASDVSSAEILPRGVKGLKFLLNVTNADTAAGDTLNVYIQESIDNVTWNDRVSFAQVVGTDAASKQQACINPEVVPTTPIGAPSDASLSASTVLQGPFAQYMRVKWVVVDADTDNASFTFGITYQIIR